MMKRQFGLIAMFSLLLVTSVFAAYRYYDPYYGGFGNLGMYFDSFLNFIQFNEYLVDAVLFLIIFLLISKKVFYKSFSEDKALYVVIGIALTIGIMVYEKKANYSLIVNSGWLSLLVLLVFAAYMATTTELTGIRITVLSAMGLVALGIIVPFYLPNFYYKFLNWGPIYGLIMLVLGGFLIYGIVKLMLGKGKRENVNLRGLLGGND